MRPTKPLTAAQVRQRTQELAARHAARTEGKDRDDPTSRGGFYDASGTRLLKRSGQRGKF